MNKSWTSHIHVNKSNRKLKNVSLYFVLLKRSSFCYNLIYIFSRKLFALWIILLYWCSGIHIGVVTLNRPIDRESKTKCFIIDNLYYNL